MGRKKVTTEHIIDDVEGGEEVDAAKRMAEVNQEVSLFDLSTVEEEKIETIHVHRVDPPEGYLGKLPPESTEADILAKWGGSEYKLEGKNAAGRVRKVRHLKLAGDPMFVSELAEERWRRLNGIRGTRGGPAGGGDQLGAKDLLLIFTSMSEKQRQEEREQREREREERREAAERERRDREERERKERLEAEERDRIRRREDDEREERRRREAREEDERRQRQHREDMERQAAMFQSLIQITQVQAQAAQSVKDKAPDPIATLVAGVKLAQELGSGKDAGELGEDSPVWLKVLGQAPALLDSVSKAVGSAKQEIAGPPRAATPVPVKRGPGRPPGPRLLMKGSIALKTRAVLAKLQRDGVPPEQAIDQIAQFVGVDTSKLVPKAAKTPPAPPAPVAEAPEAAEAAPPQLEAAGAPLSAEAFTPPPPRRRPRRDQAPAA
jgi:hypothetical protein